VYVRSYVIRLAPQARPHDQLDPYHQDDGGSAALPWQCACRSTATAGPPARTLGEGLLTVWRRYVRHWTYLPQVQQKAAFNSPVWFNVGIEKRPQSSTCFINVVQDTISLYFISNSASTFVT
jgi:ribonucleotide reductase alpha subunit